MSSLKVSNVQLGQSLTAANNFVMKALGDGTLKIANGNLDSNTDIVFVDSSGNVTGNGGTTAPATTSVRGTVTLATTSDIQNGTANKVVTADVLKSSGKLQRYYESASQTISATSSISLTHGLGSEPLFVQLVLINNTAELGYSVGDKVLLSGSPDDADYGASVVITNTNINIRLARSPGVFLIIDKTTGDRRVMTPANWGLIVRAFA